MTCDKCEHFKIMYEPLRSKGVIWDLGRAKCEKHDLIVDFANHGKFKKLECPKKEMMSKLKPCPFCGHEAIVDDCGEHRYFVKCSHCCINQDKLFAQKCDAIRAWNRRVKNGEIH